jgi:hypothetical protein
MSPARSRSGGIHSGKDAQAIVEIVAKRPFGHGRRQVPVAGGDDAHVERDRVRAAHPLDLALLQHAQELRLQRERHLGNLVEEERSALRLLELARLRARGARKRALLVAEHRRFEQILGDRGAIDRYERRARARRALVEVARHDLLAAAALSRYQDGGPGRRHAPRYLQKFQAARVLGEEIGIPAGGIAGPV